MQSESIKYSVGGDEFCGELVYDKNAARRQPLLLLAPNWLGITPAAIANANAWAAEGYIVFVADMFGVGKRPTGTEKPMEFLAPLFGKPELLTTRINAAFDQMIDCTKQRDIGNPQLRSAVGYCFGGTNVLDLARSGADLAAAVCLHGILRTRTPAKPDGVKAAIMVVHGSADPVAPKSDRDAFDDEMTAARARWVMMTFGGVLHAFTDPNDNHPPVSQYSAYATRNGLAAARRFIAEEFTSGL